MSEIVILHCKLYRKVIKKGGEAFEAGWVHVSHDPNYPLETIPPYVLNYGYKAGVVSLDHKQYLFLVPLPDENEFGPVSP